MPKKTVPRRKKATAQNPTGTAPEEKGKVTIGCLARIAQRNERRFSS